MVYWAMEKERSTCVPSHNQSWMKTLKGEQFLLPVWFIWPQIEMLNLPESAAPVLGKALY